MELKNEKRREHGALEITRGGQAVSLWWTTTAAENHSRKWCFEDLADGGPQEDLGTHPYH